jgi:hypothetical protein
MKKYILCSLLLIFCISPLYSQTGVNTETPEGALHIKSRTLPANNKGVLVGSDGNNGISIAIDNDGHPSASVSLGANNKAFMPNRVALADARGNATGNPIKNPVDGMVVYNTARAGNVPDNVIPGLYVFNAGQNRWMYCITGSVGNKEARLYTISSSLTLPTTEVYTSANGTTGYAALSLVPVGSSAAPVNYIDIVSNSAYAMMITLSGSIPSVSPASFQRLVVYVAAVLLKNDGSVDRILDIAEINPVAFDTSVSGRTGGVTYPLTLGFDAQRGDRISIHIASARGAAWTLLSGETSIIFFKI